MLKNILLTLFCFLFANQCLSSPGYVLDDYMKEVSIQKEKDKQPTQK